MRLVYDILKQMRFLEIILYFLICFHCINVGYRLYYFSVRNRSVIQAIKINIFCKTRYVQDFSYRGEFFIHSKCSIIGNYRRYHKRNMRNIMNMRNKKRITLPKEKPLTDSPSTINLVNSNGLFKEKVKKQQETIVLPKDKPLTDSPSTTNLEDSKKLFKEKVEKQKETVTLHKERPLTDSPTTKPVEDSKKLSKEKVEKQKETITLPPLSSPLSNSSSTQSFHQPDNSSFFPWDDGIDYDDVCNKLLNILRSFKGPKIINNGKHGGLGHKFISLYYTITYALVLQRPLYSIILSLFLISS